MMDEPRPTLRREVQPPPSTSSAWGLIVVAASALSCALAGSLLMVRASAEMARERTPAVIYEPPPTEAVHADLVHVHEPPPPPEACRGPVYHANGDGKAEAVFELCPPKHGKIKRIVND